MPLEVKYPIVLYLSANHELMIIEDQVNKYRYKGTAVGHPDLASFFGSDGRFLIQLSNEFEKELKLPKQLITHVGSISDTYNTSGENSDVKAFHQIGGDLGTSTVFAFIRLLPVTKNQAELQIDGIGYTPIFECTKAFRMISSSWVNVFLQKIADLSKGQENSDHPIVSKRWDRQLYLDAIVVFEELWGVNNYQRKAPWVTFTLDYLDYLQHELNNGRLTVEILLEEGAVDIVLFLLDLEDIYQITLQSIDLLIEPEMECDLLRLVFISRVFILFPSIGNRAEIRTHFKELQEVERQLIESFNSESIF